MPSIHPELSLAYLRDDGEGGVEIYVRTLGGKEFVKKLTMGQIAFNLEFLAGYARRHIRGEAK